MRDVISTIRTLLAIADGGSPYAPEREAARERAERLMLRHSIDAATVTMTDEQARKPTRTDIDIHGSYRMDKAVLQGAVYQAFGCSVLRFPKTGRIRVYGFAHDVEMASVLAQSLQTQMLTAMAAHGGTVRDRKSFAAGFAHKIGRRLREFYASALQDAAAEGTSSALVLADRSALIQAAVNEDYPKVGKERRRNLSGDGWAAGSAAGDEADIALGDRKVTQARPALTRQNPRH